MTDIYLNVPKSGAKPKSSKFKFNFSGNTYHADTEAQLRQLIKELNEIDKLQDKNKKFMK